MSAERLRIGHLPLRLDFLVRESSFSNLWLSALPNLFSSLSRHQLHLLTDSTSRYEQQWVSLSNEAASHPHASSIGIRTHTAANHRTDLD
jgi:hypothetical protein